METNMMGPWIMTPITITSASATSSTAAFSLPNDAADACFVCTVSTLTGTTVKLDLAFQTSPDGGTTYFTVARFAQITTATGTNYRLIIPFTPSGQNTGTTATNANSGNAGISILTTATNVALSAGCPIVPQYLKFNYILTATTPVFTGKIYGWGNRYGRGAMAAC